MKERKDGRKFMILFNYFRKKYDDGFDEFREKCLAMSLLWVKKKSKRLHTKDEIQDLQQDTILCFLQAMEKYNETIGRFYGLFKIKLKTLDQKFMARYMGINVPYDLYLKLIKEHGSLSIAFEDFIEWKLGYVNYRKMGVFE